MTFKEKIDLVEMIKSKYRFKQGYELILFVSQASEDFICSVFKLVPITSAKTGEVSYASASIKMIKTDNKDKLKEQIIEYLEPINNATN